MVDSQARRDQATQPPPRREDRHGWVVVGCAFMILSLVGGLTFYAMSAYIDILVSVRGFSLGVASVCPTMSAVFGGLGGLATARLMRSVPTRRLMAVGALGLGGAMVGIGASHSVWELWLSFACSGWFSAMTSVIPVPALVARWFPSAPARPLTLAMSGLAVGGAILPPIVLRVLGSFGLAAGSSILGAGIFIIIAAALPFMREPPAFTREPPALMREPPGQVVAVSVQEGTAAVSEPAPPPRLMNRRFALLFAGMSALFLSQVATTAHLVLLANEQFDGGAAVAVTVLAVGSFSGRILGIPLQPYLGLRRLTVVVGVLQAAAQLVLATSHAHLLLYLGTFLLGLAMGNVSILQSLFAIEAYGLAAYPRVLSRLNLSDPIGTGLGPLAVGLMRGALGGYGWPLITMSVVSAVGMCGLVATGIDTARRSAARHG